MTMLKQTKRCPVRGCRKVISRKWRKLGARTCNTHTPVRRLTSSSY